jgi:hypothetical protein
MIKKYIKNLKGELTHGGQFETQAECDAWIASCRENHAWGKPAGLYPESQLTIEEKASGAIVPLQSEFEIEVVYQIPDQFVIADPSAEELAQELAAKEKKESVEALNLGMDIIADIRTLNKAKLLAGTLTLNELFADQNVALIERLLWLGSLTTAKGLIQGLAVFYSAEEKAPIIAKIDAHNAKWGV